MRRIMLNILFAVIAQANAKEWLERTSAALESIKLPEKPANHFEDNLVDDLFERALAAPSIHNAHVDDTALHKPGCQMATSDLADRCAYCDDLLVKRHRDAPTRRLSEEGQQDSTDANADGGGGLGEKEKPDDAKSIWVGNVEYATTAEELHTIFSKCGTIKQITIRTDKKGNSKAFAYIEFEEPSAVDLALTLDQTEHRGRALKVGKKRSNVRGQTSRGFSGRGYGRGQQGFNPYSMMGGCMPMMMMPMPMYPGMYPYGGGGGRGRGRGRR